MGPKRLGRTIPACRLRACTFILVWACVGLASTLGEDGQAVSAQADLFARAKLEPGKEITVQDPQTGGVGHWILYLPSNYSSDKKWPVIFAYHGLGQQPGVYPFVSLTDGRGYVVVGMEYVDREVREPQVERNIPNLKRIHDLLATRIGIDEKFEFIGGGSQGGFRASDYAEASIDTWAGIIILAAGRGVNATANPLKDSKYAGKAIFLGAGENDANLELARVANDFYKARGADVTLKVFPGLGHAVDDKDPTLKTWLWDHGPGVKANDEFAAASKAQKGGKLGKALSLYMDLALEQRLGEKAASAKSSADPISAGAEKALADAEELLKAGKVARAFSVLTAAAKTYDGSEWGEKLSSRLTQLGKDPALRSQLDQAKIDADADAAEAAALSLEKTGDYQGAIKAYRGYVVAFPRSHRFAEVRSHLQTIENDSNVQRHIASKQADSDCKAWLSLARNYIDSNQPDRARVYLQKVIDTYPGTSYADTAAKLLSTLN